MLAGGLFEACPLYHHIERTIQAEKRGPALVEIGLDKSFSQTEAQAQFCFAKIGKNERQTSLCLINEKQVLKFRPCWSVRPPSLAQRLLVTACLPHAPAVVGLTAAVFRSQVQNYLNRELNAREKLPLGKKIFIFCSRLAYLAENKAKKIPPKRGRLCSANFYFYLLVYRQ